MQTGNSLDPVTSIEGVGVHCYVTGDRNVIRHVSATTVREEALDHGRFIGLYWSATGQVQRQSVAAKLPGLDPLARPLHTFELEIDGQLLHNHWSWIGATTRPGARRNTMESVVELRHQIRPVSVKVITRLDGTPVLTRWLEVTNTGEGPAALSHVAPWCGMLWNTDSQWNPAVPIDAERSRYTLGHYVRETWGEEGHFVWHALPQETFRIERGTGRSFGSTHFIVRNEITGETCFLSLAWSGNFLAEFRNWPEPFLSFRMGPHGPAPLRVLAPGETVCTPEVHGAMFHTDMDTAVNHWHGHLRASVIPPRPEGKGLFTMAANIVENPGDWILKEIDIAAEMGIEGFLMDAGWYGERFIGWWKQRGDWFEGDWLPGGVDGVRNYTKQKGLLFGLWMEPEVFTQESRLFREHPDWVLTTDDGRRATDATWRASDFALNLALPEAAKYFEEAVLHLIRDYHLDYFKIDHNMRTLEGGQNVRDGFAEHESWRHFEVMYGLFDRVRAELPDVVLENCASGGARNDLGMLSRFHQTSESDYSIFPRSIRAINAMTLFLPPEAICYYHNLAIDAHHTADLDTHLRVTLFVMPIFVGMGEQDTDRSTDYFTRTRRYIELCKSFCMPIMSNRCLVFHHTPDIGLLTPAPWCVLEYASVDRRRSYAGVFRLNRENSSEYVFRPRGINLDKTYSVTLDNRGQTFQIAGQELALRGVPIHLDTPLTSELILMCEA